MYDRPHYKEPNEQRISAFLQQYPFAFLTGCGEQGSPVATQVPVFMEQLGDKRVLRGHLMKKTDHYRAFLQNPKVLAVFTGKHSYVSATWYSNPHSASTWNYMSVHIKGTIRFLEEEGLIDIMKRTTLHFEGGNEQSSTIFDNLPPNYTSLLMGAIAGFEIEVEALDTVFKLSQNKDAESYQNIVQHLKAQGEDGRTLAAEMEKRAPEIFSNP